jgi:hypothetical protein
MEKKTRKIAKLKRPANIYLENLDIEVVPFLTWEVIEYIGNVLIKMDGSYKDKEIAKHALLLKFCTDLNDDEIAVLDFETLWVNGYIDEIESHIYGVDKIECYIKNMTNPNHQMCQLLSELETFILKAKKINWKKVTKELEKNTSKILSEA